MATPSKKPVNLKSWIISKLRRLSCQWPPRNEAKRLARRARGIYECNICHKLFKPDETVMDHIYPVVPVTGFDDQLTLEQMLGKYVISLFVYENEWQCLCIPCHDKKTESENNVRRIIKSLDSK